ncbi:MAG: stage II sporulation protein M [Propionibacteriaceae bacterium]|nr:stage II sporulation protein M [Propionibacteriaceae bacterium]
MDVDVFAAQHSHQWARLKTLSRQRRLTGQESDELVHLYRQGATHLSRLRSTAPDPALVSQLSITLVQARGRIGNPRSTTWDDVGRFFRLTMPAALYHVRWWAVGATAACLALLVAVALWAGLDRDVLDSFMSPDRQVAYANEAFASYYSEHPHSSFAALVWTNNARIAALCVVTGITGFIPVIILFTNSFQVGLVTAVMHTQDAAGVFYSLILPHGLLELSCVFVAGGAGLSLLWAWLVPGPRTRTQSLARAGKTVITVVVALTIGLGVSGLLEGFVTPSGLPPWLKIAVGALACAAFWFTVFGVGKWAVRAGEDPGVSDEEAKSEVVAAG